MMKRKHARADKQPLRIWRVFGRGLKGYAVMAGDRPLRKHPYPEIGTVTARSEAEAIAKMFNLRMGVYDEE